MKRFFHRYSGLLGISLSFLIGVFAGVASRSSWIGSAVVVISLFIFPRLFYGLKESRAIDEMEVPPGTRPASPKDTFTASASDIAFEYNNSLLRGVDDHGHLVDPTERFKRLSENEP